MNIKQITVAIVGGVLMCGAAHATTWYVAANGGSDSKDGKSEDEAFLTIQKAIDSSTAGDLIVVKDGVYAPISTGNKSITIRSVNGSRKTVIDARDSSACFTCGGNYDQTNSCVIGFSLINGHAPGNLNHGGGAYGGTIKNCVVSNCFAASEFGGVVFVQAENCVISKNWCNNNYSAAGHSTLRNCTIVGNYLEGSLAGAPASVRNSSLLNCIVWNNPAGGVSGVSSMQNCCVIDPLFVNEAISNFRLQKTSSCIDTGDNSYSTTDMDLAGNPRIYNGTIDIGAYEWKPPIPAGIENVIARQRYPWNGLVDLSFTVTGEPGEQYDVSFAATNVVGGTNLTMKTLLDEKDAALTSNAVKPGTYRWAWNAAADLPDGFKCDRVTVSAMAEEHKGLYMVVDLSGGTTATSYPVSYLDAVPSGGWSDEYKTTRLVLRRIEPGTCVVTVDKPYYIGIFEMTQKQYELVMGNNPTYDRIRSDRRNDFVGDARPVNEIKYDEIRGDNLGSQFPTSTDVDGGSYLGRIRARTGLQFDLPTEAQWEFACRAGTTTTYYWGADADGNYMWYTGNSSWVFHNVGTRMGNTWGLYDMSGSVSEWCIDRYGSESRVYRNGAYDEAASKCKTTERQPMWAFDYDYRVGFRVVCSGQ